jgi:rhodanese-related sulfurtransferase
MAIIIAVSNRPLVRAMSATMSPTANAESAIPEVDAEDLRHESAAGEVMLVDVREDEEFADEHIPGAVHLPLSRLDPVTVHFAARGRRIVLHCLSGGRSAKAGACLRSAGHKDVAHLRGGLLAWKAAGGETSGG